MCPTCGAGLANFSDLNLLIDAAAAGIFKIPAEQEVDDTLAWHGQGRRLLTR